MPDNAKTRKVVAKANDKLAAAKSKLEQAKKLGQGQTLAQFQVDEARKDLKEAIEEFDS